MGNYLFCRPCRQWKASQDYAESSLWAHFKVSLWVEWLSWKRQRRRAVIALCLPLLAFVLVMGLYFGVGESTFSRADTLDSSLHIPPLDRFLVQTLERNQQLALVGSLPFVLNPAVFISYVNSVVGPTINVAGTNRNVNDTMRVFPTVADLDAYIDSDGYAARPVNMAIVFVSASSSTAEVVIRGNHTELPDARLGDFDTFRDLNYWKDYYDSGFHTLQLAIADAMNFAQRHEPAFHTASSSEKGIYVTPFLGRTLKRLSWENFGVVTSALLVVAWLLPLCAQSKDLWTRKAVGLTDMTRVLGIDELPTLLAFSVVHWICALTLTLLLTTLGAVSFWQNGATAAEICSLCFVYSLSSVSFCLLLSNFRPESALRMILVLLATYVVPFSLLRSQMNVTFQRLAFLFPPNALFHGFFLLSEASNTPGFQYNADNTNTYQFTPWSLQEIQSYLAFDAALWLFVGLYGRQLVASRFGIRRKPLYILQKSFWLDCVFGHGYSDRRRGVEESLTDDVVEFSKYTAGSRRTSFDAESDRGSVQNRWPRSNTNLSVKYDRSGSSSDESDHGDIFPDEKTETTVTDSIDLQIPAPKVPHTANKRSIAFSDITEINTYEVSITRDSSSPYIESIPDDVLLKKSTVLTASQLTLKRRRKHSQVATLCVHDVSLSAFEGDTVCIVGAAESGKSSLLALLCGLSLPDHGLVKLLGKHVAGHFQALRREVGFSFEHPLVLPTLTVREYLSLFCQLREVEKYDVQHDVADMMKLAGLRLYADSVVGSLPLVQQRLLSIAASCIGDTRAVFIDLPTLAFTQTSMTQIQNMLKASKHRQLCVLTTQNLEEALVVADRIAVLAHGRLVCYGSPDFVRLSLDISTRVSVDSRLSKLLPQDLKERMPQYSLSFKYGEHKRVGDVVRQLEQVQLGDLTGDMLFVVEGVSPKEALTAVDLGEIGMDPKPSALSLDAIARGDYTYSRSPIGLRHLRLLSRMSRRYWLRDRTNAALVVLALVIATLVSVLLSNLDPFGLAASRELNLAAYEQPNEMPYAARSTQDLAAAAHLTESWIGTRPVALPASTAIGLQADLPSRPSQAFTYGAAFLNATSPAQAATFTTMHNVSRAHSSVDVLQTVLTSVVLNRTGLRLRVFSHHLPLSPAEPTYIRGLTWLTLASTSTLWLGLIAAQVLFTHASRIKAGLDHKMMLYVAGVHPSVYHSSVMLADAAACICLSLFVFLLALMVGYHVSPVSQASRVWLLSFTYLLSVAALSNALVHTSIHSTARVLWSLLTGPVLASGVTAIDLYIAAVPTAVHVVLGLLPDYALVHGLHLCINSNESAALQMYFLLGWAGVVWAALLFRDLLLPRFQPCQNTYIIGHGFGENKTHADCSLTAHGVFTGIHPDATVAQDSVHADTGEVFSLIGIDDVVQDKILRVIAGLQASCTARVRVKVSGRAREGVTLCHPDWVLPEYMTCRELLFCHTQIHGMRKSDGAIAVDSFLRELAVPVTDESTLIRDCSPEVHQKLRLAMAFMSQQGSVVLLHLPTKHLSPEGALHAWSFISRQARSRVIVYSSASLRDCKLFSDHVAVTSVLGQIQWLGTPSDLKRLQRNLKCVIWRCSSVEVAVHVHMNMIARFNAAGIRRVPNDYAFTLCYHVERAMRPGWYTDLCRELDGVMADIRTQNEQHALDLGRTSYTVTLPSLPQVYGYLLREDEAVRLLQKSASTSTLLDAPQRNAPPRQPARRKGLFPWSKRSHKRPLASQTHEYSISSQTQHRRISRLLTPSLARDIHGIDGHHTTIDGHDPLSRSIAPSVSRRFDSGGKMDSLAHNPIFGLTMNFDLLAPTPTSKDTQAESTRVSWFNFSQSLPDPRYTSSFGGSHSAPHQPPRNTHSVISLEPLSLSSAVDSIPSSPVIAQAREALVRKQQRLEVLRQKRGSVSDIITPSTPVPLLPQTEAKLAALRQEPSGSLSVSRTHASRSVSSTMSLVPRNSVLEQPALAQEEAILQDDEKQAQLRERIISDAVEGFSKNEFEAPEPIASDGSLSKNTALGLALVKAKLTARQALRTIEKHFEDLRLTSPGRFFVTQGTLERKTGLRRRFKKYAVFLFSDVFIVASYRPTTEQFVCRARLPLDDDFLVEDTDSDTDFNIHTHSRVERFRAKDSTHKRYWIDNLHVRSLISHPGPVGAVGSESRVRTGAAPAHERIPFKGDKYVPVRSRRLCQECFAPFSGPTAPKPRHCDVCGDVYCLQCTDTVVLIRFTSEDIISCQRCFEKYDRPMSEYSETQSAHSDGSIAVHHARSSSAADEMSPILKQSS